MDECEALADQVAILAQGKIRAVGSPHELKLSHGIGYRLTFTEREVLASENTSAESLGAFVEAHVPGAKRGEAGVACQGWHVMTASPRLTVTQEGGRDVVASSDNSFGGSGPIPSGDTDEGHTYSGLSSLVGGRDTSSFGGAVEVTSKPLVFLL